MMLYTVLILIGALAMCVFAYFKNRQANRREEQRQRTWQKQQELLEQLRNQHNDDGN